MKQIATVAALIVVAVGTLAAWHNGGDTVEQPPKFGPHDYIAFKALDRASASDVSFIRAQLTPIIGTEAPDTAKTVAGIPTTGYHDSGPCHCILFAEDGTPTRLRARLRARQEFDKAVAALHANQKQKAAFFAGTLAHYVGDLSQFCHVMGKESHWGREDQKVHAAYENVVDRKVDFRTRTSSLLESFLAPVDVDGDTVEEIVEGVARFTENGGPLPPTPGATLERPKPMIEQLTLLRSKGTLGNPDNWDAAFRNQTGINVNYAVNAIGKLLQLLAGS